MVIWRILLIGLISTLICCISAVRVCAEISADGWVRTKNGSVYMGADPWIIDGENLFVGNASEAGSLRIAGGSVVNLNSNRIVEVRSSNPGTESQLRVDGTGSRLQTGELRTSGDVSVTKGGYLKASILIDALSQSTTKLELNGNGTVVDAFSMWLGGSGHSQVTISGGAKLNGLELRTSTFNQGSVSMTVGGGNGTSEWAAHGYVDIGAVGGFSLNVIGGGVAALGYGGRLSLGTKAGERGSITVDGTDGSAVLNLGRISVGDRGEGRLHVTNGGEVLVPTHGGLTFGDSYGGMATATIGGGVKESVLRSLAPVRLRGAGNSIHVQGNGVMEVMGFSVSAGARLVVAGDSDPARLTFVQYQGAASLPLKLEDTSALEIRGGGVVTATTVLMQGSGNQLIFDSGRLEITEPSTSGVNAQSGAKALANVRIENGGGILDTTQGNTNFLMSSVTGDGVLTKTGAGRLTFSGAIGHAGTRVEAGRLHLESGALVSGAVDLLAGARMTGTGSLTGLLTIQSGAILAPGNSPGTLATGDVIWLGGGSYEWEINNAAGVAGTHWDLLAVNGTLDLSALSIENPFVIDVRSLRLNNGAPGEISGFDPLQGYRFTLVETSGGIVGFDPALVQLDLAGFANADQGDAYWQLEVFGGDLNLVYNSVMVPEPGSLAMVFTAGLLLFGRRRR